MNITDTLALKEQCCLIEKISNYSVIAIQWDKSHIQGKEGLNGNKKVGYLTKSIGHNLSDKWELSRTYPVEEVDLGAGQGGEESTCRRKSMCQIQEVRGNMTGHQP